MIRLEGENNLDDSKGILTVEVSRGGTVDEALSFLADIQTAYENLFALKLKIEEAELRYEKLEYSWRSKPRRPPALNPTRNVRDIVLPDKRLVIDKVKIESPGGWEFLGSLNPLQQIREYLKDRHERRKDKEWREAEEQRQMSLENSKREQEVRRLELENTKVENSILSEQISLLESRGYSDEQINRLLNAHYYKPLALLDVHVNSRLIESTDVEAIKLELTNGEPQNNADEPDGKG
jgi:hypothetical protein